MNEKEQCQICAYDRVKRGMITCPKCNMTYCQGCMKKFLLSSSLQTPTCMGCKVGLDLDFVISNTDPSFEETYRDYRASIIMSLEKSLIPSTQADALKELKRRESFRFLYQSNLNIKRIRKWLDENRSRKGKYFQKSKECELSDPEKANKYFQKYLKMLHQIDQCSETIFQIEASIRAERQRELENARSVSSEEKKTRYICPCPENECKGFIDDTEYKCGICERHVCKTCHAPVQDEHKCNPDTVETVKTLRKETKPCPKCRALIFKIDGCDQIWCTSCHTAFSWRTGEVETGRVHNPHYYQWMRENGGMPRERGDAPGGDCGVVQLSVLMSRVRTFSPGGDVLEYLMCCHRILFHIREVMLPGVEERDGAGLRKYIRIRYMLGDFNEKRWLSQLKASEKTNETRRAISSLLTMCVNTLQDLLGNVVSSKDRDEFETFVSQIRGLNRYVNDVSHRLRKRFKVNIVSFDELWNPVYV
jgi:hypothetical protein